MGEGRWRDFLAGGELGLEVRLREVYSGGAEEQRKGEGGGAERLDGRLLLVVAVVCDAPREATVCRW